MQARAGSADLIFVCRMCSYSELAQGGGLVYRNDLLTVTREQPGETGDLGSDMTLVSIRDAPFPFLYSYFLLNESLGTCHHEMSAM
jgi:hypothetical protein